MRVGIDVSPLVQTRAGTARYVRALLARNEYEQLSFPGTGRLATAARDAWCAEVNDEDSVVITLRFADGSTASISYLAEGDSAMPKERIEIFGGGKSLVIDDFKSATEYANGREKQIKLREHDKGQANEIRMVCEVVRDGKPAPIALEDLATTTRATFRIRESLRSGLPVQV